jgi:hypothetical protein
MTQRVGSPGERRERDLGEGLDSQFETSGAHGA